MTGQIRRGTPDVKRLFGTTPGGGELCSPLSDPSTGFRRVAQLGNAQQSTTWELDLRGLSSMIYWSVQAVDGGFAGSVFADEQSLDHATGVIDLPPPTAFALGDNFPNPFNPTTAIRFELPREERVHLCVYDVSGRRVRKLIGGEHIPAGRVSVEWNGTDDTGRRVASGTYLYRLRAGAFDETRRMLLVK